MITTYEELLAAQTELAHFNPNHDPSTGQFAKKAGGAISKRFGKRKYENPDGTLTKKGKERFESEKKRNALKKKENRVKDEDDLKDPSRWSREDTENRKEVVDATSKLVKNLQDIDSSIKPKKKSFDLSSMSDADLRSQINRLNMERQYADLMNSETTSKGRERVKSILSAAGQALAVTSSALGIALSIKKLMD